MSRSILPFISLHFRVFQWGLMFLRLNQRPFVLAYLSLTPLNSHSGGGKAFTSRYAEGDSRGNWTTNAPLPVGSPRYGGKRGHHPCNGQQQTVHQRHARKRAPKSREGGTRATLVGPVGPLLTTALCHPFSSKETCCDRRYQQRKRGEPKAGAQSGALPVINGGGCDKEGSRQPQKSAGDLSGQRLKHVVARHTAPTQFRWRMIVCARPDRTRRVDVLGVTDILARIWQKQEKGTH